MNRTMRKIPHGLVDYLSLETQDAKVNGLTQREAALIIGGGEGDDPFALIRAIDAGVYIIQSNPGVQLGLGVMISLPGGEQLVQDGMMYIRPTGNNVLKAAIDSLLDK